MSELYHCPDCGNVRESNLDDPSCYQCDRGSMSADVPRLKREIHRLKVAFLCSVGLLLFAGPPVYFLYKLITWDGPLFASREVQTTTTEYYGFIPEFGRILMVWVVLLCLMWAARHAPRRF